MNRRELFKAAAGAAVVAAVPAQAGNPVVVTTGTFAQGKWTYINRRLDNDQITALTRPADHATIKADDLGKMFSRKSVAMYYDAEGNVRITK